MKILLINDLHTGKTRESTSQPGIFRQANTSALSNFEKLIPQFNKTNYDLVFQMGDIVREVGNKKVDEKLYKDALNSISKIKLPIINMLGNHELRTFEADKLLEMYKEKAFYGSKMLGSYKLIWLDHQIDDSGVQYLSKERLTWLKNELNNKNEKIIFSHYSITSKDSKGNFYFDQNELAMRYRNSDEILKIMKNKNVKVAINAHEHWISFKEINEIKFLAIPSFTENIAGQNFKENNPAIYTTLEVKHKTLLIKSFSGGYCFFSLEM